MELLTSRSSRVFVDLVSPNWCRHILSIWKAIYIKEVYETIVTRDLVQKYALLDTLVLQRLSEFLMDNISNLTSPNKVSQLLTAAFDMLSWEAEIWIMAEFMKYRLHRTSSTWIWCLCRQALSKGNRLCCSKGQWEDLYSGKRQHFRAGNIWKRMFSSASDPRCLSENDYCQNQAFQIWLWRNRDSR